MTLSAEGNMTTCADLRVLFCAAAGARRGYGHLVRSLSFARALGVRPLLAVRGTQQARDIALGLGADVVGAPATRAIRALRPDVVVVDDPSTPHAQRRIDAARRAGALVVTIHDLGLGCAEGDVVIDGSAASPVSARPGRVSLVGTRFAILDAQYAPAQRRAHSHPRTVAPSHRRLHAPSHRKQVLIALGGGPHVRTAAAIARAIVAADPHAHVRIAGGFVARPRAVAPRVTWVTARRGLARELAGADVAIVGGGVSLYEACAMGVPAVALPVVSGQVPTVRAFAKRGAAIGLDRIGVNGGAAARNAAARAVALLNSPHQREALARRSTRFVDGQGASRAAAAVAALSQGN
jgi:spore coat polysaccharide biosynthesis predicted glycosyltransferase SpsG